MIITIPKIDLVFKLLHRLFTGSTFSLYREAPFKDVSEKFGVLFRINPEEGKGREEWDSRLLINSEAPNFMANFLKPLTLSNNQI